ncbi:MAG: 2-C-methyl-D-erythritol 4-phosphate cytidylyltransferase [Candidatus Omnitrophota bacterium]|nr:MAG: 2-C-methyl-D-erythritol 4-phosphate cytidylyltransferase [Candidatus Omnitrophota bacterium]
MKSNSKKVKAIILAGGYSRRMNSKIPKQLIKIKGRPILSYSLDVFERCRAIDGIILVAHKNIMRQCHNLIKKYNYKKIKQVVRGGKDRQQSVFNALEEIKDCDYVIIHDGVRPFVNEEIISRVIKAAFLFGAASAAIRTIDTIVETKGNFIDAFLCRDRLMNIQTPQAARFDLLIQAHRKAKKEGINNATDDAQLLFRLKRKVKLAEGSRRNIKITKPFDLCLARALLEK